MITSINNDLPVYQVVTSLGKQVFCNITELNECVELLGTHEGYFKIYHFWNNKAERLTKKALKEQFEGANLTQKFFY
jgi:hypothetical protein